MHAWPNKTVTFGITSKLQAPHQVGFVHFLEQVPLDNQMTHQTGLSRVAAVGPYIQFSTKGSDKQDLLIKTLYSEGTAVVPHQGRSSPPVTGTLLTSFPTLNHI